MAAFLPVFLYDDSSVGVSVNIAERIEVFNAAGTEFEITNTPDATPIAGGKFPVYLYDLAVFTPSTEDPTPIAFSFTDPVNAYIGDTDGDAAQGSRGLR